MRIRIAAAAVAIAVAAYTTPAYAGLSTDASGSWTYTNLPCGTKMCGVLILNLPGARNLSGPVSLNGIDGNVLGTNGAYVVILNKPINPGAIWTVSLGGNTYQTKGTGLYAVSTTVTPEPVSMTLVATGLTGIGFAGMRKRKKNLS